MPFCMFLTITILLKAGTFLIAARAFHNTHGKCNPSGWRRVRCHTRTCVPQRTYLARRRTTSDSLSSGELGFQVALLAS